MTVVSCNNYYNAEIKNKAEVLRYMKSGKVISAAPSIMRDHVTNERTGIEFLCYSDGQFLWSSDVIYHAEKYDMRLPMDFINHIVN